MYFINSNIGKLDDRYFIGLEGQYIFTLHFRLEKEGETDYIVRSHGNYEMKRSVNVDIELEAGTYFVLMKISAKRDTRRPTVNEVIRDSCRDKQDKVINIGLAYDLAHAKGQNKETQKEKNEREAREEKKRVAKKKLLHAKLREQKLRQWQLEMKQRARERRHSKKKEDRHRKKAEAGAAAGATGQDGPPDTKDASDEADPSYAATNGVATAEAGSDLVENKEGENLLLDHNAAHLPSPPADLSSPAAATPPGDLSPPIEAETETKHSAPIEPTDATTSTEAKSKNEVSAPGSATEEQSQKLESPPQDVPAVLVNGTSPGIDPAASSTAGGPPPDDSDYASDASFDSSVDSDLDFLEGQETAVIEALVTESDDEDAEFANDPWNAVCVVGLRVYSKDQDTVVEVVRPTEDDTDDEPARDIDDVGQGFSREPAGDDVETKTGQE